MDLDLSTERLGDRAVVSVGGEVDLETASRLGAHTLDAMREVSPHLVLDLSGVTFMDSTGLKVLLSLHRRAEAAGGTLAIAGASRSVRKVLSLTGLDQAFSVYDTVADATRGEGPATAGTTPPTGSDAAPTA
jgi:anti-anti-sigma factor